MIVQPKVKNQALLTQKYCASEAGRGKMVCTPNVKK